MRQGPARPLWHHVAALVFVAVAVVHLAAQLAVAGTVAVVTQWLLMPLLAPRSAPRRTSDGLIALDAFAPWYAPPVPGFWVMSTYFIQLS